MPRQEVSAIHGGRWTLYEHLAGVDEPGRVALEPEFVGVIGQAAIKEHRKATDEPHDE